MAYTKKLKLDNEETLKEINRLADYVDAQQASDLSAYMALAGAQNITGKKTFSSMPRIPINADVAGTGTVQADAAAVSEGFTVITGANGTLGWKLPVAVAGAIVILKGTTNGVAKIWPNTGASINAVGTDTAMSLASGLIPAFFFAKTATQWYTVPLLPS